MRNKIKNFLRVILGKKFSDFLFKKAKNFRNLFYLVTNTLADFKLYYRYSTLFRLDSIKKQEALLILDYHSIEKGMLYLDMKPRFAQNRVERIHKHLKSKRLLQNLQRDRKSTRLNSSHVRI